MQATDKPKCEACGDTGHIDDHPCSCPEGAKHLGPPGLFDKYIVIKERTLDENPEVEVRFLRQDGVRFMPGSGDLVTVGDLKRSWCFVVSPEKDDAYGFASRRAMIQYARDIEGTNPNLARDLREKVLDIQLELAKGRGTAPVRKENENLGPFDPEDRGPSFL
jgi:hypothetical protein